MNWRWEDLCGWLPQELCIRGRFRGERPRVPRKQRVKRERLTARLAPKMTHLELEESRDWRSSRGNRLTRTEKLRCKSRGQRPNQASASCFRVEQRIFSGLRQRLIASRAASAKASRLTRAAKCQRCLSVLAITHVAHCLQRRCGSYLGGRESVQRDRVGHRSQR
jgi:hypothetical protein